MSLFDAVKRWYDNLRGAKPARTPTPARMPPPARATMPPRAPVPARTPAPVTERSAAPSPVTAPVASPRPAAPAAPAAPVRTPAAVAATDAPAPKAVPVLAPSDDDVSDSAVEAAAAEPGVEPNYQGPERRERQRVNARAGTRALIVDDSTTVVTVLRKMLQQNGYQTYEAYTAEEALELARDLIPDIVFLDIVLPGMDGFAALRALRKDPTTKAIPVIMISGNMQATEQFYVQRIGADDFMKKPFSRPEVFSRIERLLDDDGIPRRVGMQMQVADPS